MTRDPKDTAPEETDAWAGLGLAWRAEQPEVVQLRTVEVARRARRFAWTVVWRNTREIVACVALIAWAARDALRRSSLLEWLPYLAMIAAAVWVGAYLVHRGRNLSPPPTTATTSEFLAYERGQIERQRRLLRGVRKWYLGPLLVAVLLSLSVAFLKAFDGRNHHGTAASITVLAIALGVVAAVFALIDRLNARAAEQLGEKLRTLGE